MRNSSISRRRALGALLLALLLPALSLAGDLPVRFVDIGQGESILLHTPGGKSWLVDGGPRKNAATDAIVAAMAAEGLDRLDGIVITHPHIDHFGGLIKLVEKVPVGRVLYNLDIDAPSYRRLTDRLEAGGIPYQRVTPGRLHWDPDLDVKLLAAKDQVDFAMAFSLARSQAKLPPELMLEAMVWSCGQDRHGAVEPFGAFGVHSHGIDLNDYSIVLKVDYGEFELLLTGDATEEVEERLVHQGLDVDVDVLKVAHHGSRYSNTLEFLQDASPEEGVIQCATGNSYGHPHREALRRLQGQGTHVWRTDRSGGIVLVARSDGQYQLGED